MNLDTDDPVTQIVTVIGLRNNPDAMTDGQGILDTMLCGVAQQTLDSRLSQLRDLKQHGYPYTPKGLMSYCHSRRAEPIGIGKLKAMEQTLRWCYRLSTKRLDPEKDGSWFQLSAYIQGYTRKYPTKVTPKGAINMEQFKQMLAHASKIDAVRAKANFDAAVFQYAFAFRPGHVEHLKYGHFSVGEEGIYKYHGPNLKCKPKDPQTVTHHCMPELNETIKQFLSTPRENNTILFGRYDFVWIGSIIKSAAVQYQWPKEVLWNGAHCLRHGSIAQAVKAGGLLGGLHRAGHYCEDMIEHCYGPSTEERIALMRHPTRRYTRRRATKQETQNPARTATNNNEDAAPAATAAPQTEEPRPKNVSRKNKICRKPPGKKSKKSTVKTSRRATKKIAKQRRTSNK